MTRARLRTDWPTFWGAVSFLIVGGGFAIFGAYQLWTTRAFMAEAYPVQATVLKNPADCDDEGCTWWPTLQVPDDTGGTREMRTRFGASNYDFSEGEQLEVLVNDAYPYVRRPGPDDLYLLGGGFFAIGMLPVCIAIWLLARMTFTRIEDTPSGPT